MISYLLTQRNLKLTRIKEKCSHGAFIFACMYIMCLKKRNNETNTLLSDFVSNTKLDTSIFKLVKVYFVHVL